MSIEKIINLALGKPSEYEWNKHVESSGIGKVSVQKIDVKLDAIVGDGVGNPEFHGGQDRVVCLYPYEHYSLWEKEFQTQLPVPAFGENITAIGMKEETVCIGDIYKIGEAVLQITQGRIPCSTISKYNGINSLLRRIVETSFTGYFFRVLEEGSISVGSTIQLMDRHPKGISVLKANQVLFHELSNKIEIKRLLEINELAEVWKQKLMRAL